MDDLPVSVCRRILQDCARFLVVSDIELLPAAIRKLNKVVQTVPKVQQFVRDVCALCGTLDRAAATTNGSGEEFITPSDALAVLHKVSDHVKQLESIKVLFFCVCVFPRLFRYSLSNSHRMIRFLPCCRLEYLPMQPPEFQHLNKSRNLSLRKNNFWLLTNYSETLLFLLCQRIILKTTL